MLSGQHADVASILTNVECLAGGLATYGAWNRRALAIYGGLLLLLCFPLFRGWGKIVVEIKLPPRTRGFLRIKLGTTPEKTTGEKGKERTRDGRLRLGRVGWKHERICLRPVCASLDQVRVLPRVHKRALPGRQNEVV